MVAERESPDGTGRSRGQLILIGAIAIGIVIIGLVVVINTVLVAENISTSESLETTDQMTRFSANAQTDMQGLILRLNHRKRNMTADELTGYIYRNTTNYSRAIAESYAQNGVAVVNVSFNNESSEWGMRIVQVNDSAFTSPNISSNNPPTCPETSLCKAGGQGNWSVVNSTDVRRFVVNLNVSNMTSRRFNVSFTNQSDDYVNISMYRGTGNGILVSSERSFGRSNVTDVRCDPSGTRVLLNLMSGTAFTGDCEFNGVLNRSNTTRTLQPPYTVNITNGSSGRGQFSLVVNRTLNLFAGRDDVEIISPPSGEYHNYEYCDGGTATNPASRTDPCRVPAVWTANITTTYQSASADYWQQHNVSVYP